MTNNLFEVALEKGEVNSFFRGEDNYFIPSPGYEGHVHGAHMGGCVRVFVEKDTLNAERFDEAFIEFLKGLELNKSDLNHLLANLSAFFSQKSRNGFSKSRLFNSEKTLEYKILFDYIKSIYQSDIYNDSKEQLARHASFIERKGYPILNNICRGIKESPEKHKRN